MMLHHKKIIIFSITLLFLSGTVCPAATNSVQNNNNYLSAASINVMPVMVALGDSLGEGVQSADASWQSQVFSYLNFLAWRMNLYFTLNLPTIQSGPFGWVGDTSNRSRIDVSRYPLNLSVSGADVNSLLYDRANAMNENDIDSETDLVLFPWQGSQMEIAEYAAYYIGPLFIACWIGNNDVLSAAIPFDQLDASQMTPVAQFQTDFLEIVQRLDMLKSAVVFANIPDVTKIGFLVDRQDLINLLGSDYGLPENDYTSVVEVLFIMLGLDDGSLIQDPDFVLDAGEVALIQQRTDTFNQIIDDTAALYGYPVVDIHSFFNTVAANPPVFFGIPLTNRFLGGLFSLDGVHPSNIGHALIANAFIEKVNEYYQTSVPLVDTGTLEYVFLTDPFVDKDGDGIVTGRSNAGLLETIAFFVGISGDSDDFTANSLQAAMDESTERGLKEQLPFLKEENLRQLDKQSGRDIIKAFKDIFDFNLLKKSQDRNSSMKDN
jgi:hypothetical protein